MMIWDAHLDNQITVTGISSLERRQISRALAESLETPPQGWIVVCKSKANISLSLSSWEN